MRLFVGYNNKGVYCATIENTCVYRERRIEAHGSRESKRAREKRASEKHVFLFERLNRIQVLA